MKRIKYPSQIKLGDTLGIVAPSGPSDPGELEAGIQNIHSMGFNSRIAGNVTAKHHFLAGDREVRLRETVDMLLDDSVDAVLCARGGDGAIHLLPEILDALYGVAQKAFIGYSDITLLQLALYKRYGWVTFSGPMLVTEFASELISRESIDHLFSLLMKPRYMWNLNPPAKEEIEVWRDGETSGPILGGCLSLICSMLGSPYLPDLEGAVLIIEDTEEQPKHIDRMLHQLRISGVFEKINGLIIGGFADCFPEVPEKNFTLQDLVLNATRRCDFPIIANYPYGHNLRDRLSIPLGAPIQISTDPLNIQVDTST